MKDIVYITTPLYYVNDVPHIGHSYTNIASDVAKRYYQILNRKTFLLTGTDEHGLKIQQAALTKRKNEQEFVDSVFVKFKDLWKKLNIDYDDFIRTTDEKHIKTVQDVFTKLQKNDDIYYGDYEGLYCTPCETYWTESAIEDNKCPDCNRELELVKEKTYFFKLSKYQEKLKEYFEGHPDFVKPKIRYNEAYNLLKETKLNDLSISRSTFKWGINVPASENDVIYVWFDALLNYISAIDYTDNPEKFFSLWPADFHIIGKDILRFHCIIWPCILLALDLPLPKCVFAHGWWTVDGEKMSKSKGNVIDPFQMIEKYSADAYRFMLLREVTFGLDGDFSEKSLINRYNTELADTLGNLVSRFYGMLNKYNDAVIPSGEYDKETENNENNLIALIKDKINDLAFKEIIEKIFMFLRHLNAYIQDNKPWELYKNKETEKLNNILYTVARGIRFSAVVLSPILTEKTKEIIDMYNDEKIGTLQDKLWIDISNKSIKKIDILFKKIEND